MNEPLTESTFVDEVWGWGREIMAEINQVPAGQLRTNVSLMAGYASGAAMRIQSLERRLKALERAAKDFLGDYRNPKTPPDVLHDRAEALSDALAGGGR